MRALVILLGLSTVAAAKPRPPADFTEPPDAYQLPPPLDVATHLDRDAAFERAAMFDRAVVTTTDPRARANLLLALGDLWTGYALHEDALFVETMDLDHHIAAEVALDRAKIEYQQLARDADLRGWPNLDDALIHYAFVLRRKHEPVNAALERFVAEFPASPNLPYAYLALGDEAMWHQDTPTALVHYTRAAGFEFPDRAHALYKQAWFELHMMSRPEVALTLLEDAATAQGHERMTKPLERELVSAFVRAGAPSHAFETFHQHFPDDAIEMLDAAATQWQLRGNRAQGIAALRELLRRMPVDPRSCKWEIAIARQAHVLGDHVELLASVERLVQRSAFIRDPECESLAAAITLENARTFAQLDRILAERLYDLFLRAFPQHEDIASARLERIRLRIPKARPPPLK